MVRTTEERLLERFSSSEDALRMQVAALSRQIEEQKALIQAQHEMLIQQGELLRRLIAIESAKDNKNDKESCRS